MVLGVGGGGDMRREQLAELMIGRAERWLQSPREALNGGRYDDAVYCAQMCAEHASKAALTVMGIEYPKVHDVSDVLMTIGPRLPAWFRERLDEMCRILTELAEKRGLAGYGFEKGLDVSHFAEAAPVCVKEAEFVLENCRKLVENVKRSPINKN